jgi:endonuclease-3
MAHQAPATRTVNSTMKKIARVVGNGTVPSVSQIAREKRDPYRILISTVISLRTKDDVTLDASRRLFKLARDPKQLVGLHVRAIEKAIYPAGFYKTKARTLKEIARKLLKEYDGKVPDTIEELLTFKGVGRKTATLVVSLGYGKPAICVDTHVHRISNRMGWIETSTPDATEFALMDVLPEKSWIGYNELLVSFGQQLCKPISPLCSQCPVASCPQIGVTKHR